MFSLNDRKISLIIVQFNVAQRFRVWKVAI
jgi:hypothetical protein